jgi:preprotein translocase subunit SecF
LGSYVIEGDSTTTLGALFVLWLVSTSDVIDNIAIVLIFGLLADFMNTWILNAGVLRWYITSPYKFTISLRGGS